MAPALSLGGVGASPFVSLFCSSESTPPRPKVSDALQRCLTQLEQEGVPLHY